MVDNKNGFNKNNGGRLLSAALEEELAGFEERGIRTCKTRIPGKSCLPKVLLTSNPLIERDLQKTLKQIHTGKSRRRKTWEWNQKQFFVSQIFDPDYNLRFTQRLRTYSDGFDINDGPSRLTSVNGKRFDVNKFDQEEGNAKIAGLGVFMTPLHPSQRLIEKQKIPNSMLSPKRMISAISTPNLAALQNGKNNIDGNIEEENNLNNQRWPTIPENHRQRETTTIGIQMSSGSRARMTLSSAKYSAKRDIHKSVSLPEISVSGFGGSHNLLETGDDNTNYHLSRKSRRSNPEVLCEEKVIVGLTRSLPLSVMIKANQNINRVVKEKKAKMIQSCKHQRDKNTLEDPRWKDLHKALVGSEQ